MPESPGPWTKCCSTWTFIRGFERDLAAVTPGLTLPWGLRRREGHVNRPKMIKRQILRKRVLLAA
ncbi:hypothetical protein ACFQ9Q_24940 [Streptomyces virginiae]|uniref:hypothetical protein n=1 Tax=Streptomyces virginiae TaxID=1961 RepID=UPI0036820402